MKQLIEQAIHEYVSKYGTDIKLWHKGGHHARALAQSIADRLEKKKLEFYKEAYEQGKFDAWADEYYKEGIQK